MGAISDRLNAPMIFIISLRFASLLFLRSYLTYSYRQDEIILKSCSFSFSFSLKSTEDCFRLVAVELTLALDSSRFLLKLMTLMVCLAFFPFFCYGRLILWWGFANFEVEKAECTKGIDAAQELSGSFLHTPEDYFSSVFRRWKLGVRDCFW